MVLNSPVVRVGFVLASSESEMGVKLERRPSDGSSRSLQREFEITIMVEVRIEEMFSRTKSDRKIYDDEPWVVEAEFYGTNKTSRSEWGCVPKKKERTKIQKLLYTTGIVEISE